MFVPQYPEIEDLKEINVVPLVDVMLVLLVIFMATAPLAVGGLTVKLPQSSVNDRKPPSSPPLVVTIKKDGKFFLDNESFNAANLQKKITSLFELSQVKAVYLRADKRVNHGRVVLALTAAKQAGATNIKIITEPPKRR